MRPGIVSDRGYLLILVVAVFGVLGVQAQTSATSAPSVTLQAELLKPIDASHTKAGDEIFARTVTLLEFDGIKFPVGAIVSGHITKAEPNLLVMVFDQLLVKKNPPVPLSLSLRAVMLPQETSTSMGKQISPTAEAGRGGALLRSPQTAAQDSTVSIFDGSQHPIMAGNGGVIGLMISRDPKIGSALQSDPDKKLKLEKGLQLMFVVSK